MIRPLHRYFVIVLKLWSIFSIMAINPIQAQAPSFFSKADFDGSNTNYFINKSVVDSKGNRYITGAICSISDMDPGPEIIWLTPTTNTCDVVLAKYNSAGGYEWAFTFGSTGSVTQDEGIDLKIDPITGDVIVIGKMATTADYDPGPGIFNLNAPNFLARYTTNGDFVNAVNVGAGKVTDLNIDATGNILVTGNSAIIGVSGFLNKYTSAGVLSWSFTLSPGQITTVATDAAGNIFISGEYTTATDMDPGAGVSNFSNSGMFIAEYNPSGQLVFAKGISNNVTSNLAYANDLFIEPNGNLTLTGYLSGNQGIDFDPGPGVNNLAASTNLFQDKDIFLARFDNNGQHQWAFTIGSPINTITLTARPEEGKALTIDGSGNIFLVGVFRASMDFDPGPGNFIIQGYGVGESVLEGFVAKYNSMGQFNWAFKLGHDPAPEYYDVFIKPNSINLTSSDNIVVGSTIHSYTTTDIDPGIYVANFPVSPYTSFLIATYVEGKTWNGNTNSDWNNAGNWQGGSVPGINDKVLVPTYGVMNELVISSPVTVKNVLIQTGRTITLNSDLAVTTQVNNTGTFINNGNLTAGSDFINAGNYKGTGTFTAPLFYNAVPSAIVEPGNSPGCQTYSNDFKTKGELKLEINGTNPCSSFDRINVGGIATVGGKLFANFGFTPSLGQSFQVINAAGYAGNFTLLKATPSWGITYLNGVLNISAPLPLNLFSFSGSIQQQDILLQWKTKDATNLGKFIIERSTDGISFSGFDQLSAINGSSEIDYTVKDINAAAYGAKLYYRLQTLSLDGTRSFSKILMFIFSKNKSSINIIYPNPSQGIYNLVVSGQSRNAVSFTVINLIGQQVFHGFNIPPGNYTLDLSNEPAGIYFIKTDKGEIYKLVKQ